MNGRIENPTILVVAAMPPPIHGQSIATAKIVEALSDVSCKLVLVDTSPRSLERTARYHARRIAKVGAALLFAFALSRHRSKRLYTIVESGYGIVYNFALIVVCRLLGYETFLHHHTARYFKRKSTAVKWLIKLAGRNATHIVLSDAMATDLRRLYPAVGRTFTLHNGYIVKPLQRVVRSEHEYLRLGLLSNLSSEKGLDTAIETYLSAARAGLNLKLILAGPLADNSAAESLSRAREKGDFVEYRGSVSGGSKCRFFADIDVFLFPTRYANEAQPLVVLEAMAASLPIIVNDRGYISELVGSCGVLVGEEEDYVDVAVKTIRKWCRERKVLRAVGEECRHRFCELNARSNQELETLISRLTA